MRLSQVVSQEVADNIVSVMSGPSHAEEVAQSLPTTNVVACEDIKVAQFVQDIFMSPRFRVYTNSDVIGVELGGALKMLALRCRYFSMGLALAITQKQRL